MGKACLGRARCRERGVETIAAILSERLMEPAPPAFDARQMALPIS
jgi:hypothetical protein